MEAASREEVLQWLRLARTEGVGPITCGRLLALHGSVAAVLKDLQCRPLADGRPCRIAARSTALEELAALQELAGHLLIRASPRYPGPLRELPDAPPVLSARGDLELLHGPAVAVVGARNASAGGCVFARRLAQELASAGMVVVSGLARGIDTAAHEGALAAGGATVAVIATGVDIVYPPENAELMEQVAAHGAVVSERPLGAIARAKDFPRRNRVIAGLSLGVVVVEAAPASGSLITARLALDYGREVMAVPGSPLDPRHRGTNQLLREGAHLVESAADVLAVLGPVPERRPAPPVRAAPVARSAPKKIVAPPAAIAAPLTDRVMAALGPTPLAVDELIRECDAAAPEMQAVLLELELAGRIDRQPGNRVCLRAG
ncbi:MAG: DNA-processing protein DprA [Geminicoccaceae bacterium]